VLTLPPPPNKDEIITVSPSQIDVWNKCKYNWKLNYLDGWVSGGQSLNLLRGTITHKFMEKFYNFFLNGPITPIEMDEVWKWRNELEADYRDIKHLAVFNWAFQTFLRYAKWASENDDFIPLATEQELFAPTGLVYRDRPVYLHGIVDLIVDRAGEIGVMDHKSHYQENGAWTSDMVYFDQQIAMYMLMLDLLGYTPTVGEINSVNTFEYKQPPPDHKLFSREPVYHKRKQLENYKNNIYEIIDDMQTSKHYPKRWTKDCKWCSYKEVCDTQLRGHNPIPLLRMKHSRDTELVEFESPLVDN